MEVTCPFCLEPITLQIYLEDGEEQEFTYDCSVCCHPIDISATWDADSERFDVSTDRSGGFD